jgi:hypothetical protein
MRGSILGVALALVMGAPSGGCGGLEPPETAATEAALSADSSGDSDARLQQQATFLCNAATRGRTFCSGQRAQVRCVQHVDRTFHLQFEACAPFFGACVTEPGTQFGACRRQGPPCGECSAE